MKTNQRTIKVYDTSHALASRMSNRFGISMSAVVELALRRIEKVESLDLPARPKNGRKMNARRALAS